MGKETLRGTRGANNMKIALQALEENLFPGLSITILVGPFNAPSIHNYVSNGRREDMIKVLRETADRIEQNKE